MKSACAWLTRRPRAKRKDPFPLLHLSTEYYDLRRKGQDLSPQQSLNQRRKIPAARGNSTVARSLHNSLNTAASRTLPRRWNWREELKVARQFWSGGTERRVPRFSKGDKRKESGTVSLDEVKNDVTIQKVLGGGGA